MYLLKSPEDSKQYHGDQNQRGQGEHGTRDKPGLTAPFGSRQGQGASQTGPV